MSDELDIADELMAIESEVSMLRSDVQALAGDVLVVMRRQKAILELLRVLTATPAPTE